jgi:hypothetical protein
MPEQISLALPHLYDAALAWVRAGHIGDIIKVAVGAFIGAGLALLLALSRQSAARRRERKAAGNLALITLDRLASDFVLARAVILNYREFILRERPRLPPWLHVKAAHFGHAGTLRFEPSGLQLLLEQERGAHVVRKLLAAESAYHDFFWLLRDYIAVAEVIDEKLSLAGIDPADATHARELDGAVGAATAAKAERLAHAILAHVERSEALFREAATTLPVALGRRFGKKGLSTIEIPTYSQLRKMLELSEDGLRTPPIHP